MYTSLWIFCCVIAFFIFLIGIFVFKKTNVTQPTILGMVACLFLTEVSRIVYWIHSLSVIKLQISQAEQELPIFLDGLTETLMTDMVKVAPAFWLAMASGLNVSVWTSHYIKLSKAVRN